MPSFDVVSNTDLMEVDNAINGVKREIKQRWDLKGSKCNIERIDNTLTIIADDNMKLTQVEDLLRGYLARRKVDQKAFQFKATENAAGDTIRRPVSITQGIDAESGREITKAVKSTKIKVQVSMQGDEIRISGKKRDDLQETIAFIEAMHIERPLQFVNFRD